MKGNGYIELNRSSIFDGPTKKDILVALLFSTTHPNGLLFWYGQNKQESYNGQDFVALAVVDGYLEYAFRLNSEEAMIKNIQTRVDDGGRHIAIIKRTGNQASMELDGLTSYGESRPTDKLESILPGHLFFGKVFVLFAFALFLSSTNMLIVTERTFHWNCRWSTRFEQLYRQQIYTRIPRLYTCH